MSFFSDIFDTIGDVARPALSAVAPIAGGMLGGSFGGPMGAALGSSLGSSFGNMLGGGQHQQAPTPSYGGGYAQPTMPSRPNFGQYGRQMGNRMGNAMGNAMGSAMPQQYRNTTIGQAGNTFGGAARNYGQNMMNQYVPQRYQQAPMSQLPGMMGGDFMGRLSSYLPQSMQQFSQPLQQMGQMAGNMFSQNYGGMIPNQYRNMSLGQMPGYAGQRMSNAINQGVQQNVPEWMQGMSAGNMGQQFGQMGQNYGNQADSFMQQPSYSSYGGGSYGGNNGEFKTQPMEYPNYASGGSIPRYITRNLRDLIEMTPPGGLLGYEHEASPV